VAKAKLWEGAIEIATDLIFPDPLNPNVMDDFQFNNLVEAIEQHGFDEPLQVVVHPENPEHYIIVGGEHRWRASKVLGMETLPCVVKTTLPDELTRHIELVRRNLIHGDLDKVRFSKMIANIRDKHSGVSDADLAANMGFQDMEEFERQLIKEKEKQEKKIDSAVSDTRSEIQIVDNISYTLTDIFSKYGDTIPQGYIFFFFKNKLHLMIQSDNALYQLTRKLVNVLQKDSLAISGYLTALFERAELDDTWPQLDDFIPECGGGGEYEPSDILGGEDPDESDDA